MVAMTLRNNRDLLRIILVVTAASILLSWCITFLAMGPVKFQDFRLALFPATLTPLLLAPVVTYAYGRMHFRMYRQSLELERLAAEDVLTGLLNRRAFWERSNERLAQNGFCALILLDADHFKRINDKFGHGGGDETLKAIGTVLRRITGETYLAARVGGEEFAVLLNNMTVPDAMRCAERIRRMLQETSIPYGDGAIRITASFGVAARTGVGTIDELYHLADEALYRAKDGGRNRIEVAVLPAGDEHLARVA